MKTKTINREPIQLLTRADKLLAIALLRAAREVSIDLRTMGFETWADKLDRAMRDAQLSVAYGTATCECGHEHDDHHRGWAYGLETFNCELCRCPEYSGR